MGVGGLFERRFQVVTLAIFYFGNSAFIGVAIVATASVKAFDDNSKVLAKPTIAAKGVHFSNAYISIPYGRLARLFRLESSIVRTMPTKASPTMRCKSAFSFICDEKNF